jgi:hypothetical protein
MIRQPPENSLEQECSDPSAVTAGSGLLCSLETKTHRGLAGGLHQVFTVHRPLVSSLELAYKWGISSRPTDRKSCA